MSNFELPLRNSDSAGSRWGLLVRVSPSSRLYGGSEPWFEVKLSENGKVLKDTVAVQPFSCFKSVVEGRRTALMCEGGVMALHKGDNTINLDFHNSKGVVLHVESSAEMYQKMLESLASVKP